MRTAHGRDYRNNETWERSHASGIMLWTAFHKQVQSLRSGGRTLRRLLAP